MTVLAYGFAAIHRRDAHAAPVVLLRLDSLKVVRAHAVTDPAQVVDVEPGRDRSDQLLIHQPMRIKRRDLAFDLLGKDAVAIDTDVTDPEPARLCLVDAIE